MYLYLIDDAADNIPFSKLLAKSSTTDDKAAADDSDNSSNDDDEKDPKSTPVKQKRTSKKISPVKDETVEGSSIQTIFANRSSNLMSGLIHVVSSIVIFIIISLSLFGNCLVLTPGLTKILKEYWLHIIQLGGS